MLPISAIFPIDWAPENYPHFARMPPVIYGSLSSSIRNVNTWTFIKLWCICASRRSCLAYDGAMQASHDGDSASGSCSCRGSVCCRSWIIHGAKPWAGHRELYEGWRALHGIGTSDDCKAIGRQQRKKSFTPWKMDHWWNRITVHPRPDRLPRRSFGREPYLGDL